MIYMTPEGDIDFYKFTLVSDPAEKVVQIVREKLRERKGEWFLDTTQGIDYRTMLGKNMSDELREQFIKLELTKALENMDVIRSIEKIDVIIDSEKAAITVNIKVIDILGNIIELSPDVISII